MIRPLFTELALFLVPFALYAVYLWATKAGVLNPEAWSLPRVASLAIASLLLVFGSFVFFAQFGGEPPRSNYVPPHVEDGKLVPGHVER